MIALTSNLPAVVTALRSPHFRNLGVRVTVASTADELLQWAAVLQPDLVVVLAGTGGARTGFVKALRSCLNSSRTVVLHAISYDRSVVDEDLTLFDGIVSLEDPAVELARLVSQRAIPPRRKQTRTFVRLPMTIDDGNGSIAAVTLDLTSAGVGMLASRMPQNAGPYQLVFLRDDGRRVAVRGQAVWADALVEPTVRLGVRFVDIAPALTRELADLAFWSIEPCGDGEAIHLHGELSELTDFSSVAARVVRTPVLDLRDTLRVNSCGVLKWVDFVRSLPMGIELRLRRVSVPLMRQMELVPLMLERCVIESHYARFDCDECEREFERLVTPPDWSIAEESCPLCGSLMPDRRNNFDDATTTQRFEPRA